MGHPPTLDYATPTDRPRRARLARWGKRCVLALLILASVYAAQLAWLYWGWWREQPARERVLAVQARVNPYARSTILEGAFCTPCGPAILDKLLPDRLAWIRERVTFLNLLQPATDEDLRAFGRLTRLQWLSLSGTSITDAGLVHLKQLTKLEELSLGRTSVTDEGVTELQKALPNCRISH